METVVSVFRDIVDALLGRQRRRQARVTAPHVVRPIAPAPGEAGGVHTPDEPYKGMPPPREANPPQA